MNDIIRSSLGCLRHRGYTCRRSHHDYLCKTPGTSSIARRMLNHRRQLNEAYICDTLRMMRPSFQYIKNASSWMQKKEMRVQWKVFVQGEAEGICEAVAFLATSWSCIFVQDQKRKTNYDTLSRQVYRMEHSDWQNYIPPCIPVHVSPSLTCNTNLSRMTQTAYHVGKPKHHP